MKKQLLFVFALLTCGAMNAQVYLSESFDGAGTDLPAGWSVTTADATSDGWLRDVVANLGSTSWGYPDNGTKVMSTNDDGCNCNKSADRLIFPSVNLSSASAPFVTMDQFFFNQSYQGSTESGKIQVSTNGGSTWTDLAAMPSNTAEEWEQRAYSLSAYVGQSSVTVAVLYNDGGGWTYGCGIDNVEILEAPAELNATVVDFVAGPWNNEIPGILGTSTVQIGREIVFGFAISNTGGATINSFDLYVTGSGGQNFVQSFSNVNLGWTETEVFYLDDAFAATATGTSFSGMIMNINGGNDANAADNEGGTSATFTGITLHPDKAVLIEEATGTWCGWCPRGTVMMKYMENMYPDNFVGVAVHNADPMVVTAYDSWIGGQIGGYPSCLVDRDGSEYDPLEMEEQLIAKAQAAPDMVLGITHSLSGNTLTVDVSATYNVNLSGDYRFNVVLIEDHVSGTGGDWGQTNYYSGGAYGPMGIFDESGPTVSPISYDHVGRALLGGTTGTAGSLPADGVAGQTYTYQYTTTVDPTWALGWMHPAVFVLNNANGEVVNAKQSEITVNVNEKPTLDNSLVVYPNPSNGVINIQSNLTNVRQAEVRVYASTGELVLNRQINDIRERNVLDVSEFGSGIYTIVVDSEGHSATRRVTVIK